MNKKYTIDDIFALPEGKRAELMLSINIIFFMRKSTCYLLMEQFMKKEHFYEKCI